MITNRGVLAFAVIVGVVLAGSNAGQAVEYETAPSRSPPDGVTMRMHHLLPPMRSFDMKPQCRFYIEINPPGEVPRGITALLRVRDASGNQMSYSEWRSRSGSLIVCFAVDPSCAAGSDCCILIEYGESGAAAAPERVVDYRFRLADHLEKKYPEKHADVEKARSEPPAPTAD